MKKFSKRDKQIMAHGRNLEKFEQIIKDKKSMINTLEREIKEIELLIDYNKTIENLED